MQTMSAKKVKGKIEISHCETHHICNGEPLYEARYEKVLSFHNDIAPVYTRSGAFFINTKNKKLFNKSFIKAFGFYEGLAAVCDKSGFYHILESGVPAYSNRFAWCGNFVENACVVMNEKGEYFHIDSKGEPLYKERFSYVGDFKYNIAVATLENNKCVHIFKNAKRVHNKEFLDLEPFHKGVAVAKDSKGYFHIDKNGNELYTARYKKIEPFYNGRAFGLTQDMQKVVLNEEDLKLQNLNIDFRETLSEYFAFEAFRFYKMRILYAILKLNILENIESNENISLQEYPKNLIISWLKANNFLDSNLSLSLKAKVALELKKLICYWQGLPFYASVFLKESLRDNSQYLSNIIESKNYFRYIATNDEERELFSFISSYYSRDYDISYFHFSNEIICDIGCGSGTLLDSIKQKYPHITAIYADLKDMRIKHIREDSNFIYIDFFKKLDIKADVFLLSRILHDYNDDEALKILKNIACSMQKHNVLYIFETLCDGMDLGLDVSFHLLNFLGGKERSKKEIYNLLKKAGLKILECKSNNVVSILKVVKDEINL